MASIILKKQWGEWRAIKDTPRRMAFRHGLATIFLIVSIVLGGAHLSHAGDNILQFLPAIIANPTCSLSYDADDPKYDLVYKGLYYYQQDLSSSGYKLRQLSDGRFNRLSMSDKRKVADKLLTSLFFGYPAPVLDQKLTSSHFLCSVRRDLSEEKNNMPQVEAEIRNEERYYREDNSWRPYEVFDILARFYAMEFLDKHYLHNWIAYILTQNIMFSPAYELDSSHYPDVASVYNWLVMDMNNDIGMRYSTYLHMTSTDNWRRFRSPEDNGREMLEIYTFDFNDADVPKAATTLKNWFLDEDHDTLVIGLNQNTVPQALFGTTVTTGFDFYRELVKSNGFISGSVRRLVDFFFTDYDEANKQRVTNLLVSSHPETWQDVLLQIVFSEEYLLHASRAKSAEELFYSLVKKLEYKHYRHTFYRFNEALDDMHQSSMKYKLGKLERTPLDTLSFAHYHKYIRETILLRNVCGTHEETTYDDWNTFGWRPPLLKDDRFDYDGENNSPGVNLNLFITYLFEFMVHRPPTAQEMSMFQSNMLSNGDYRWTYNLSVLEGGCYSRRENAAEDVLDYISRLSELYMFQEVH
jgi:hypothetical protein